MPDDYRRLTLALLGSLTACQPGSTAPPPAPNFVAEDASTPDASGQSMPACAPHAGDDELRDEDGDGVPAWWRIGCEQATLQERRSWSNDNDCDDLDPSVSVKGWRDADGDGWTVGSSATCLSALEPGYRPQSSFAEDCDDTNPQLKRRGYADDDRDGGAFRVRTATETIVVTEPLPPGAVTRPILADDPTGFLTIESDGEECDITNNRELLLGPAEDEFIYDACGP